MNPERVWTNSRFGRALCTIFGLGVIGLRFNAAPDTGRPWRGTQILVDLGICGVGVAVLVAVWTSRLVLKDGTITATNFFRSRSIPLAEVEHINWSGWPGGGGKLCRSDGSGIRTLVTGTRQDEFWTSRAERIEREILELAAEARGEGMAAMGDSRHALTSVGSQPGNRFALVRWREGYDCEDVDAFLVRAEAGSLTSTDVADARFKPVRLRPGYDMGQVDAYLDGLAAQLPASSR